LFDNDENTINKIQTEAKNVKHDKGRNKPALTNAQKKTAMTDISNV